MLHFLIRRIFWAFFLFIVATLITYIIFFVIPSDPAQIACGTHCTPQIVEHVRKSLHLDLPIYQQYWIFLWNLIRHGSLGYSFANGATVDSIIKQDAPVTASLVFGGAVFWLSLSIPIGILSALRPRSALDRGAMLFVLIGISAPAVWIGLILAYTDRVQARLDADRRLLQPDPGQLDRNVLGPGAMGVPPDPAVDDVHVPLRRPLRAPDPRERDGDDVGGLRAHRAGEGSAAPARVLFQHVLRNSMLPVVTILGMDIGLALGGAVFTETVFQLRGLGSELIQSATRDDLPVIVGIVMFACIAVIIFNFIVDVAYAWLDPRIRLTT